MADTPKPLTPREADFVRLVLAGVSGSAAYRAAGWKAKNTQTASACAARLLANASVKAALAAANAVAAEEHKLTASWLVQRLMLEAQGLGKDTTPGARVRALEILGRRLPGFFPPEQHEFSGPGGGAINVKLYLPANSRDTGPAPVPTPDRIPAPATNGAAH